MPTFDWFWMLLQQTAAGGEISLLLLLLYDKLTFVNVRLAAV